MRFWEPQVCNPEWLSKELENIKQVSNRSFSHHNIYNKKEEKIALACYRLSSVHSQIQILCYYYHYSSYYNLYPVCVWVTNQYLRLVNDYLYILLLL